MDYGSFIKEIGRGKKHARDLDQQAAFQLYRAMLLEQVPELELGAILLALRIKGEAPEELLGFYQAMQQQMICLQAPKGKPMPVILPSYNGARKEANLTPLLALLIARVGVPVVVHGVIADEKRVTSAEIFQALDIPWSQSSAHAQQRLDEGMPVFIPTPVLSAPLAKQLALRERLGVRNSAHILAKLATPFGLQAALRVTSVSHPEYMVRVGTFFEQIGASGILLPGTEGEVYANPKRCPDIYMIADGNKQLVSERFEPQCSPELPLTKDVHTTADWIKCCMAGKVAVPQSLIKQVACILFAIGQVTTVTEGIECMLSFMPSVK